VRPVCGCWCVARHDGRCLRLPEELPSHSIYRSYARSVQMISFDALTVSYKNLREAKASRQQRTWRSAIGSLLSSDKQLWRANEGRNALHLRRKLASLTHHSFLSLGKRLMLFTWLLYFVPYLCYSILNAAGPVSFTLLRKRHR
jgi:hypothetical protein